METFAHTVTTGICDGRFRAMLKEYCLQWRKTPTRYVIGNVVTHLADASDHQDLFETLTDSEFRRLKLERLGINALRADLQRGLDFFSKVQPYLFRYIQILFLERRTGMEDNKSLLIHERYCEDFGDFLQLNVPFDQRQDVGVHRVLNRVFPLTLKERDGIADYEKPEAVILISLTDYELGGWRCRCGGLAGQVRRFDYACQCGAIGGNGLINTGATSCSKCGHSPTYRLCSSCGTRVTLDLIWRVREETVHPSDLNIPLTVTLSIKRPSRDQEQMRLILMHLPLMLGMRERDGQIVFHLPDAFWLNPGGEDLFRSGGGSAQIAALGESIHYDRRTELRGILESILRRTLLDRRSGRSLMAALERAVVKGKYSVVLPPLTQLFINRLVSPYTIIDRRKRPIDLMKLAGLSLECAVAASPLLSRNMIVINRSLLRPGALCAPFVTNYIAVLKHSMFGDDLLTPTPLGQPRAPGLGYDGIVRVGALVKPGEPLVGIESPRGPEDLTPEEKLLRAIFDENVDRKDASLTFEGANDGRVLAVNVVTSGVWEGVEFESERGKSVKRVGPEDLGPGELARITISLSIEQKIEVGDILYADDGHDAVICGILGGSRLATIAKCPAEPDLVIAPDHPWAPAQGDNSQLRYVRVAMRGETLLGQEVSSRSSGPYSLISAKPLTWVLSPRRAQEVEAEDFDWLLACSGTDTAFELFGPRCDCVEWRRQLFKESVDGRFRLVDLNSDPVSLPRGSMAVIQQAGHEPHSGNALIDSPSYTAQSLGFFLRGAGITASFMSGYRPRLAFRLITEQEKLAQSRGEVTKPETVNYRTSMPERNGLFCAKIFGPVKDYQCLCGKYNRVKHRGVVCETCGVEVTVSSVRRQRVGHISFAVPLVNPWYLKLVSDHLASRYKLDPNDLKAIVYYEKQLAINAQGAFITSATINGAEKPRPKEKGTGETRYYQGGEAIQKLLEGLNEPRDENKMPKDWQRIVMRSIVVIPPTRRPIVPLHHGRYADTDLNYLYRRVIERNNRLKRLGELCANEIIMSHGKVMLQRGVDTLFNPNLHNPIQNRSGQPLVSLADKLIGFSTDRSNFLDGLLRRPIDYSARTRLVVGDTSDIDSAFIPERLAWDLLRPLIIRNLEKGGVTTIKRATKEISERTERAYEALRDTCRNAIILASPSSAPWRLIALQPRLTSDIAFCIHSKLMDILGWGNLGKQVRLFAVLSEEAEHECLAKLLPSKLCRNAPQSQDLTKIQREKSKSIFFMDKDQVISLLSRWALERKSYILNAYDQLILCIRDTHPIVRTVTD